LRRFSYPEVVQKNRKLDFESWWENKGVAPSYVQYPLAIRLKNKTHESTMLTKADVREWLPGDIVYNDTVFLPVGLPAGDYQLEIALVETPRHLDQPPVPKVKLAIEGITPEGWYSLGEI